MRPCLLLERPRVSVVSPPGRKEGKEREQADVRKRPTRTTCSASASASASCLPAPSLKRHAAGVSRNCPIGVAVGETAELRLSRCRRLTLRKRGGDMSPRASLFDFSQLADKSVLQSLTAFFLSLGEGSENALPWPINAVVSTLAFDLSNLFAGTVTRQSVIHALVSDEKP